MSPWASASPISDAGRRRAFFHHPAELGRDAEHRDAELGRLGQHLGGRLALVVGRFGGRADLLLGERAARLLEHLLLVVGGDVEEALRLGPRLARRFAQLLGGLEGAPGGGRGAEAVLGALEEGPLDPFADADAVEQVGAREPVQPSQADAHRALGHALVGVDRRGAHFAFPLALDWVLVLATGVTRPSRWRFSRFLPRSRTVKSISLAALSGWRTRPWPAAGSAGGSGRRRRRRRGGAPRAPPAPAPWSTSRGRSPPGSRAASRSASACGSGCGRRRRRRSGGRGRRGGSTRRSPATSSATIGNASRGAAPGSPLPRRRKVLVALPGDLAADPDLGDDVERLRPFGCGCDLRRLRPAAPAPRRSRSAGAG